MSPLRAKSGATSTTRAVPATTSLLDAPVERAIAHGRLLLCLLSFFFLLAASSDGLVDVIGPAFVLTYTIYAIALTVLVRRWHPGNRGQLGIHVIDVMAATFTAMFINPSLSPAIAFFTFVLLAATLRWNWYGVIGTAAVLAFTLGSAPVRNPGEVLRVTRVFQGLYLGLAGAMLAYVAAYLERRRRDLAALARWPAIDAPAQQMPVLTRILAHVARVVGVPRILVVWNEHEEPDTNLILLSSNKYEHRHEFNPEPRDLVLPDLAATAFAADDAGSNVVLLADGSHRVKGPIFCEELKVRFAITSVATAPLSGKMWHGRLFLMDRESWNTNHLALTEIVASRLVAELDRQLAQIDAERTVAAQERIRLSRDLHDGLLQTLAAIGFHVKALTEKENPIKLSARIETIRDILANEQARIRAVIDPSLSRPNLGAYLQLDGTVQRFLTQAAQRWGCSTSIEIVPIDATVPSRLIEHLSYIFEEAIANAVRHGLASNVDVKIRKDDGRLTIGIRDNGRGFGRTETYNRSTRSVKSLVMPASICDRVGELGGSISLQSLDTGAELTIRLTLP